MCDIDFFKAYNDTYGHQRGDECLQLVAGALVATLRRPRDVAARYGGEEFAVILSDTDARGAFCVAEAIRRQVAALGIVHHASKVSKIVTVSLGLSTVTPSHDLPVAALISAADQALYRAKEGGRNMINTTDLTPQNEGSLKSGKITMAN